MKQETYYVVVNSAGDYLTLFDADTQWWDYQPDIVDARIWQNRRIAEMKAKYNNGTVKEVTITIKD